MRQPDLSLPELSLPKLSLPELSLMAVLLAGIAAFAASPAAAETLADALRDTYAGSPRLDSERARLRATDEAVPQALGGWRPQIRASGEAGLAWERDDDKRRRGNDGGRSNPNEVDRETDREADRLHQLAGRLLVQQSIYAGGETVASTRRAENLVLSGRARLDDAEQTVLLEGVEAYAAVVRALAVLGYSRENLDRLRRYLEGTQERFRVAELTRTDVAQAQSRVAGAEADLARAENELETALAEFQRVVGRPPEAPEPPGPAPQPPASLEAALALIPSHPRVQQAAYDLEAQRQQVRVDEAQLLPDVNLVGDVSRRREPSQSIDLRDEASIGAELVIPIYQRGIEYSRVRQAKQSAIQRRYELTDVEQAVRREIIASFDALQTARRQIVSLDQQVEAARAALDGTREEAIVGARTVLDLLNAELELFTAQTRRARAAEQEVVASYRLRAATGDLDPASLGFGEDTYDPTANYRRVRDRWFGLSVDDPGAGPAR
jgi:TolC family type I secretion outer membrane protein